jgi:hypothetical protein
MKSLNKVQLEILRQFEKCDSEEDLKLLRKLLAKFWLDRAVESADKAADERGYTAETFEQFRQEHMRVKSPQ